MHVKGCTSGRSKNEHHSFIIKIAGASENQRPKFSLHQRTTLVLH